MKSFLIALAAAGLTSALAITNVSSNADVNVIPTFGSNYEMALTSLFATIESIPDEVLLAGDRATEQWLANGGIASSQVLESLVTAEKREESASPVAESTMRERAVAGIWDIAACVAAIVSLLASTAIPAAKLLKIKKLIEELGGVRTAVELLIGATFTKEKLKAVGSALATLAAELLGIAAVKNYCF